MKRRIGKFYITREAIDGVDIPEVLKLLSFTPYRVELIAHRDKFEYIGTSDRFDELDPGAEPPEYQIIINTEPHPDTQEPVVSSLEVNKY